jgi:hypothetical protein
MDKPYLTVHDINIYQSPQGFYVEGFEEFHGTLQEAVNVACAKFCLDFVPVREKLERFIGLEDVDQDELAELMNEKHLIN